MIEKITTTPINTCGFISADDYDKVKNLFVIDKELAGELAISIIELAIANEKSTSDERLDTLLADRLTKKVEIPACYDNDDDRIRIKKLRLLEIAFLIRELDLSNSEIARSLNLPPQTIYYRVNKVLYKDFPELLKKI